MSDEDFEFDIFRTHKPVPVPVPMPKVKKKAKKKERICPVLLYPSIGMNISSRAGQITSVKYMSIYVEAKLKHIFT